MILIRRHLLPKRRKLDILVCLFSQRYNMGRRTNQSDFFTGGSSIHRRRHPQSVPYLEIRRLAGAGFHGKLLAGSRLAYAVYDEPQQRRRKCSRRKASPPERIIPAPAADRLSHRLPHQRPVCTLQIPGHQLEPHGIPLTAACR